MAESSTATAAVGDWPREAFRMGIREWANGHPKVTAGVVSGAVVLVTGGAVIQAMGNRHGTRVKAPDSYYSDDDGKTWFAAPSTNYAPFDHDGRSAVRAYVFQCDGKKFVGVLERFNAETKRQLDAGQQMTPFLLRTGRDMKRPGDVTWVPIKDIATENKLEDVACPAGSTGTPEVVEP